MTIIYLTQGTTSWTVPGDWNNASNSIETIGGGGGGATAPAGTTAGSGGGGAYSKVINLTLTPGNSVTVQVGAGGSTGSNGTDTWLNGASLAASSVGSKGGTGTTTATAGTGGAAASGIGTTKNSGGDGSVGGTAGRGGCGAGGAAGPNGVGGNGAGANSPGDGGQGGGGNGGGGNAVRVTTDAGGNGGTAQDSTAGGTGATSAASPGNNGSHGSGGGGGFGRAAGGTTSAGGNGGNGIEFDSTHGSGGGGAGGGGSAGGIAASNAGNGGNYGGGGGGGGWSSGTKGTGGAGANGLIIITYTPVTTPALPWRIGAVFWHGIAVSEDEPDWLPRRGAAPAPVPARRVGAVFWHSIAAPEDEPDWLPRRRAAIAPAPVAASASPRRVGAVFWQSIAIPEPEPEWLPRRRVSIAPATVMASAQPYRRQTTWNIEPATDESVKWRPVRRFGVPATTPSGTAPFRRLVWNAENEDAPTWHPGRRVSASRAFVAPIPFRRRLWQALLSEDDGYAEAWYPRRPFPMGQVVKTGVIISTQVQLQPGFVTSPTTRVLDNADPLWVAVEFDLFDRIAPLTPDGLTTIRLSNRGPLTRTVGGVLYQYEPRLHVPILLGTTLTIFSGGGSGSGNTDFSMFQQPLRGQPNGGTISWALDPEFANDLNFGRYRWLGRTFRVYEGITPTDIGVDVDGSGLTLVYTGHIAGLTYDLASTSGPVATIQTTDASSDLDKTLVDDLYPSSFPIVTLQGKTKPELRGRALSIEPVLEDQANLIYRVTRVEPGVVELDDVTELRVGGVPWERVSGGPRVQTYLIIGQAGVTTAYLMFYAYPADVAYWQNAGISITLSSSLPPLQPNGALYNIVQNGVGSNGGPSYIGALTPADVVWWQTIGSSIVTPYTGSPPPPSGLIPPPPLLTGPAQGQWAADLASGTVQLGSVTGGAEVRVDAQAVGWETLDTAQLITDICTDKGVPVDPAYMAQLRIDWPGLTSYFTPAGEGKNTLNAIDEITLSNLCWWSFGSDGAVIAGLVDGPNDLVSDFVLFGANPQIPLDVNRLPNGMNAIDPVPKELASNSLTQILPPAWRARLGYAKRWSPGSQFLGGITDEEQSFWRAPELVEDFTDSAGGWSLSPQDGAVIRQEEPRAQDLYISTLAWREAEAQSLRTHLVRRITTNADREIYDVTAWMPAAQIKLFQTITKFWLDANARTQAVYVGTFRATSVIRSIGGGAQQLELWGGSNAFAAARSSSFSGAQMAPLLQGIAFTVFTLGFSSRAGSVVAIVNVRTSNGAPFGGVYSFGAPFNDSGGLVRFDIVTPTNVDIVLARDLSLADVGAHSVTVSATFNTTTVSNSFTFTINQAPGVEP